jgi:hypothetical protein
MSELKRYEPNYQHDSRCCKYLFSFAAKNTVAHDDGSTGYWHCPPDDKYRNDYPDDIEDSIYLDGIDRIIVDVWVCKRSVLARYSSEPRFYASLDIDTCLASIISPSHDDDCLTVQAARMILSNEPSLYSGKIVFDDTYFKRHPLTMVLDDNMTPVDYWPDEEN